MRLFLQAASIFCALIAGAVAANAQAYPNRIIKLIVPYPAGGVVDITGRLLADQLQKELKKSGHSFSRQQIVESLNILANTKIVLTCHDDDQVWTFSPIETLGFKWGDWPVNCGVTTSPNKRLRVSE